MGIINLPLLAVFAVVDGILYALNAIAGVNVFPAEVYAAWNWFFGLLGYWNAYVPLSTALVIGTLTLAVEYVAYIWKFMRWILSLLRGVNLYSDK